LVCKGFFGGKDKKKNAMLIPHVLFWSVWRVGSSRIFEGVEISFQHYEDNLIKTICGMSETFDIHLLMLILQIVFILVYIVLFVRCWLFIQPFDHDFLYPRKESISIFLFYLTLFST